MIDQVSVTYLGLVEKGFLCRVHLKGSFEGFLYRVPLQGSMALKDSFAGFFCRVPLKGSFEEFL
jgi:hypothetical protein